MGKLNGEIADSRAEGINGPIITIYPVTVQDEGEYYCVISNEGADRTTHTDASQQATISLYGEALHASVFFVQCMLLVIIGVVLNCNDLLIIT